MSCSKAASILSLTLALPLLRIFASAAAKLRLFELATRHMLQISRKQEKRQTAALQCQKKPAALVPPPPRPLSAGLPNPSPPLAPAVGLFCVAEAVRACTTHTLFLCGCLKFMEAVMASSLAFCRAEKDDWGRELRLVAVKRESAKTRQSCRQVW
jgi:hypothetical protein